MSLISDNAPSIDEKRYFYLKRHNAALRSLRIMDYVMQIKTAINDEDICFARQLFYELEPETRNALWVASSYGGIFTTEERKTLK